MRLLLIFLISLSVLYADDGFKKMEQAEIEKMEGCYEVTFDFAEFGVDTTDKYEKATEWIKVIDKKDGFVSLQHLLVSKFGIIKHWRQDWEYEADFTYDYANTNQWIPRKNKKNREWTQRVFQVDDSPRYECSAKWTHIEKTRRSNGRHFWKCEGLAALPRREKTSNRRAITGTEQKHPHQYNLMLRRNVVENLEFGWVHRQLNDKVYKSPKQTQTVVGTEIGYNTYKKIDDKKCEPAVKWWEKHSDFWSKVRDEWNNVHSKNQTITLATTLKDSDETWVKEMNGRLPNLYEIMFKLDEKISPASEFDFKMPGRGGNSGYEQSNVDKIIDKIGKDKSSIQKAINLYLK